MSPTAEFPIKDFGFYIQIDGNAATVEAIGATLARLPDRNRWCVEFGAADGLMGSTSRDLILQQDYSAVLIEGSESKFQDLARQYVDCPRVITRNKYVGFQENDGLDSILAETPIPRDFDFLTVDIDGNDFHAWNAVRTYHPKVVMIEFNPTIPPEVEFVQAPDPRVNHGSSLTAISKLAKQKGYELISVIGVNAIFVRRELYDLYGIKDNRVESLWTSRDCVTYLFTGYDGRVFLRGCQKLPWLYDVPIEERKLQAIPSFLWHYPPTRKGRILLELMRHPVQKIRRTISKFIRSS